MDMLDRLAQATRERVEAGFYTVGPRRPTRPPDASPRSSPSLVEAVGAAQASGRLALVTELKPASPSAGALLADPDRDVARVLADYAQGGADGLSVLTDATYFGGSLAFLDRARSTGLATLMKDFLLSVDQLEAARAHGASAVLAILTLFRRGYPDAPLQALIEAAQARGLEVLLEVNGPDEYAEALETNAEMIGINNRNLATLAMDLGTTERVLACSRKDRPVWALSGVETPEDLERMRRAGADAVLIGTSLMTHPAPRDALRTLHEHVRLPTT